MKIVFATLGRRRDSRVCSVARNPLASPTSQKPTAARSEICSHRVIRAPNRRAAVRWSLVDTVRNRWMYVGIPRAAPRLPRASRSSWLIDPIGRSLTRLRAISPPRSRADGSRSSTNWTNATGISSAMMESSRFTSSTTSGSPCSTIPDPPRPRGPHDFFLVRSMRLWPSNHARERGTTARPAAAIPPARLKLRAPGRGRTQARISLKPRSPQGSVASASGEAPRRRRSTTPSPTTKAPCAPWATPRCGSSRRNS